MPIMQAGSLGLDAGDPLVAVLTWALTAAVRAMLNRAQARRMRHVLPLIAVLLAVGGRAAVDVVQGQPLSWEVVARGAGAAGIAVLLHSQAREVGKARAPRERDTTS